jgi:hypothetical protein
VIGHEYAHLILGHVAAAEQRRGLLTLLGELAGAAIEYKTATKTRVQGVGMDLGLMGASLISYKFDRDQEREADVTGFRYMVDAGFNPLGAMRLAETMQRHGAGGIGLFYDNHPGWQERADLFQALIKANPMAQATIARTGSRTALTTASIGIHQPLVALVPAYQASAAEKALADGLAALDRHDFPAAVPAIQSSAAAGYAPAQNALGYLYSKGLAGLPKDEVAGVRLFRLAAAQSDMYGMNNLGAMYMFGRGGLPIDQAEALRLYRAAATQRNPVALNNLGEAYHFGATAGIDRDDSAARTYFQQAADAGNGDALAWLGWFFQTGSANLQKSMSTAITMYRRAADKGSALGQYRLALCYINGNCELPKDAVEGAKWLRLSADQDYAGAQYELGRLYYDGAGGLPKNEAKAAELYKLSADSGFGHSQAVLGAMYQRGEGGLPTNPAEGLRLINLAATQGDAGGELALAYLYEHGVGGVPKDMEAAAGWYRKAAAQGVASATDRLRELHAN